MKLFFSKGQQVQDDIFKYLSLIKKVKNGLVQSFNYYMEHPDPETLMEQAQAVHSYESDADDLVRKIEHSLYGKVLLPEFRADLRRLLERLEAIPGACQTILFMTATQHLKIPEIFVKDFIGLLEINAASVDEAVNLVSVLLENPKDIENFIRKIDKLESRSDTSERSLIFSIFKSKKVNDFNKLMLKELVIKIGNISDYAESVCDMVSIIDLKVKV